MLRSEPHKSVQLGMGRHSSHSYFAAKLRPVPGHLILGSALGCFAGRRTKLGQVWELSVMKNTFAKFASQFISGCPTTLRSKQGQQPQWQNSPWLWGRPGSKPLSMFLCKKCLVNKKGMTCFRTKLEVSNMSLSFWAEPLWLQRQRKATGCNWQSAPSRAAGPAFNFPRVARVTRVTPSSGNPNGVEHLVSP